MEQKILSREEMEAEIERFDRMIHGLTHGGIEPTADSNELLEHYKKQREYLANYLKRIDSADVF
jgi:hypothetical protein